jgi:hypothetical protein
MLMQDPDPAEITSVRRPSGRHEPGEGHRHLLVDGDPPMPDSELRHRRCLKECKTMKLREDVRNLLILSVDSSYSVHGVVPGSFAE